MCTFTTDQVYIPQPNPGFKFIIATLGWLWKNILKPVIKFISDNIDVFSTLGLIILGVVAALKAWAAIQAILNVLLTANPIGLIVAGIAALIFGILMLVKHWDTVVRWLKETGQKIADFLKNAWEGFRDFWIGVWEKISKTAIDIWNGIVASLESTGNSIIETLESAWNGFLEFWKGLWDSISKTAGDIWDGVLKSVGEGWDSFIEGVTGLWNDFMNFIQPAIDVIEGIFGESKEKISNPFEIEEKEKKKRKNPGKMEKEELEKGEATKRFRELSGRTVNPFEKEISMKGMVSNRGDTTIATTINMTLPPGTPEEQIRIIRENTDRIMNEAIDRRLKQGLVNI